MNRPPATTHQPGGLAGQVLAWTAIAGLSMGNLRAGDILRGGAPAGDAARRSAAANQATAAAAAAARSSARDSLARTTGALNAVKAMQAAARAAAAGNNAGMNPNLPGTPLPNVPNGLTPGGLQVDPGVIGGTAVWSGATLPTQSQAAGRTTVNIKQTQQTALLSWQTFNVGRQTTLRFDQSSGGANTNKWIAFNKVNDPTGAPSQILGSIQAPGQVYVINRNGIIFGAGSQVNAATLVASSLPINDNLVQRGLLNNPDAQFLFSGLPIPAGTNGTPAFTPEPPNPAIGRYGDVIVQRGATLFSPSNEAKVGGRVMLVGPNVKNDGTIRTPDGQTILAAGLQVGINAHSSADPSLRGLDVFVGAIQEAGQPLYAGSVTNSGLIESLRGSVTMAGKDLNQFGAIESSTSVSLNGRIDLLASYDAVVNTAYDATNPLSQPFLNQRTGTVRLGRGSVTRVMPEYGSSETSIGTQLALRSQVNITGRAIHLAPESRIHAPSGQVNIRAGEWVLLGLGGTNPNSRFLQSVGQVYLDAGSLIDVAGTVDVSVPVTQNILSLELRGAEFANSPLQRAGVLRGATVNVDIRNRGIYNGFAWVGTPLADVAGFVGLIQRTVEEFTAPGGSVTISAGNSVVMQPGSKIDVSGGTIEYQGGFVQTTRLLSGGRLVDIKDATPDRVYDGIYEGKMVNSHDRWGITEVFDQPLALTGRHWENTYTHGAAGGSIAIQAPGMALDGGLIGRTVNGPRQREDRAALSSLKLTFLRENPSVNQFPLHAPTPPTVIFSDDFRQRMAGPFRLDATDNPLGLRADRLETVYLSPSLYTKSGFGTITVENNDGDFRLPEGVTLETPPGGGLTVKASNIGIAGSIFAPSGNLSFTAYNLPLDLVNSRPTVKPTASPSRGRFTLAPGAILSTAGLVADDRASSPVLMPISTSGGTVQISAFSASLAEGALIDVSGGAQMSPRGRVTYGNAGSISVAAGRDLNLDSVLGGTLTLGSTLRGYSGATGGSLSLTAPAFHIGNSPAGDPRIISLTPDFFSTGGFADFSLTGIGLAIPGTDRFIPGVNIAPGTRIRPVAESFLAIPHAPNGGGLQLIPFEKPEGLRSPVNLTFAATGANDSFAGGLPIIRGDVVLGANAEIETDGLGSVTLRGQTVTVLGSVRAPGGRITVSGANSFPVTSGGGGNFPLTTVYIGSQARLDASGKSIIRTGRNGWREGLILAGGSISVAGNIVAERGAVLDVSGTSGTLDLPATYLAVDAKPITGLKGTQYVPVRIDTNGGSISLAGGQMLYTDATLIGRAGGPSAIGGSLTVSSGRFLLPGVESNTAEANLIVTQSGLTLPDSPFARGIGLPVRARDGSVLPGIGNFTADRFSAGGFDSLTLGGNVRFQGPVNIEAPGSLRVATGGVIYADNRVQLAAPYVALGQAFRTPALAGDTEVLFTRTTANGDTLPYTFAPTWGTGSLIVRADLLDIGNLSLQGIGNARFLAPKGDIRGNGTLNIAGNLFFEAGQIYPTTLSPFNIFAYDYNPGGGLQNGTVTIAGGSSRSLPLSAGGTLTINASEIHQGGTLRAPIGAIQLGWDGSGTAPVDPLAGSSIGQPVTKQLTLASGSVTSVAAVDPRTGAGILIPYGISFDGNSWIDPAGNDITVGGVPAKSIRLSGQSVTTESGSTVDIRGGGDLYAYRWIPGNGGSRDILASSTSFAVIPGFGFNYAPYGAFNNRGSAVNLAGEPGYVNSSLRPGDQVTLGASSGLPAGTYTLLPARYALLPGAFLVTPLSGAPVGSFALPDGSSIVSAYRANNLDSDREGRTRMIRLEVAPGSVVRQRAEYQDFFANAFLRDAALARDFTPPRLPVDSGYLAFSATAAMAIAGEVLSTPPRGGRGSLIDISSPIDIVINADGSGGLPGTLTLAASKLSGFNAESLLIGGLRTFGTGANAGTATVNVTTGNITVNNAGSPLSGTDMILAAKGAITLAPGAEIHGTGSADLDRLIIGDAAVAGSGDGSLLRVAGSQDAPVTRLGVGNSILPAMNIGAGASLTGGSLTVDSTFATNLNPTATLTAPTMALNSGQISVQLNNPGALNPTVGLVLSGQALASLQDSARDLSLLSYSTFDVYGNGSVGSRNLDRLAIQAGAIRGFNTGGGTATFTARDLLLENTTGRTVTALPVNPLNGKLAFDANQITLGANALRVERFATVEMSADTRLITTGTGSFSTTGALDLITPVITGAGASRHSLTSGTALRLIRPAGASPGTAVGGLGADLTLQGSTLEANSDILLPSGRLTLRATTGALSVGNLAPARIDLAGVSRGFLDVTRDTDGGTVNLEADNGSITLGANATIDVSAPATGGNAGAINVRAPNGSVALGGSIRGTAAAGQRAGSFTLDAGSLPGGNLGATDAILNAGQFNEQREYRVHTGNLTIDGLARARTYRAFADNGSITVSGTGFIDASGVTGGDIELSAKGSLIVQSGARLDASGQQFDAAGQGGSIFLGAGATRNGVIDTTATLDVRAGSTLSLGVAALNADSARNGQFTGTLHLRAPQNAAFTDVLMAPIGGTISGASSILVEGYRLYDLTATGGALTNAVRDSLLTNGNNFIGSSGVANANYTAMLNRVRSLQPGLDLILAPGAEILNRNGSLAMGSTASATSADWNLGTFRFGPRSAPGVLTMRASENLVFFNALSDGFSGGTSLWLSPLNAHNPLLPANTQSWSYRLAAGADTSSANFRALRPLGSLAADIGNLQLGKNAGAATASGGANAQTSSVVGNNFQVIRTGSGDIDIAVARNVQLLNPFAAIYTAGTAVPSATTVVNPGDFSLPNLNSTLAQVALGARQQIYPAQYSSAGGNVNIFAGENIERKTRNNSGLIDDSSRQLPNNWLYRRGHVGADGNFGLVNIGSFTDPNATTTWWVDFSNFFQSVGALGGGNVTLAAGNDVKNVDAVIPTNARAAIGAPANSFLLELGGGDLVVRSGNDINAGIYYVERGRGALTAGGSIVTNETRSPSLGIIGNLNNPSAFRFDSNTWLPTTLFVGRSFFDVSSRGDALLGPITNTFLLPQSVNNRFYYKTYFNTFGSDSGASITSLGGDITFRNAITTTDTTSPRNILSTWYNSQQVFRATAGTDRASFFQPWLRLAESSVDPFATTFLLQSPNVLATALSGDVNLQGSLTLFPSPIGQLELIADGSINAFQPTGLSNVRIPGQSVQIWTASSLNVSDANPASVPSALSPFSYFSVAGSNASANTLTQSGFFNPVASLFTESGSTTGAFAASATKQALHTPGLLHLGDPEPIRLYATGGNLSGLQLFTPKATRVHASRDLTDIAFYLQNLAETDTTILTAGRDIVPYNAASPLRAQALSSGNAIANNENPLAGDIVIGGPGSIQVLAGRDLDLGTGPNNADGTGVGLSSVGNNRNPFLPFTGAHIVAGAGLGPNTSLLGSDLDVQGFIDEFVEGGNGQTYLAELGVTNFDALPAEEQARVALEVFYLILRDAGRGFNDPASPGFGNYDTGFAAIEALFGGGGSEGDILTRSRSIRTRSGGNISLFAPAGGLTLSNALTADSLVPPGIVTESGGNVNIFTDGSVDIGVGRIFTLRGGDMVIWSSTGDIAAGTASKTVQSAPPTRVIIDPQSATVETDLAGLATGGGIGVLATVAGVEPGNVDLIAPSGIIDAGDAGIRVTGNINLAATQVLNASNIAVGGSSAGAPSAPAISTPNVGGITSAGNTAAATSSAATTASEAARQQAAAPAMEEDTTPSIITVEVLGYGGGAVEEDEEERKRREEASGNQ
ncbi:MAG: filamentous hemagglutinin family protein [Verrucomicrobiales bacterium]|nr:filamentous hemagglutinin family protein [Verrucomicrobiales bacterium]